MALIGSLVVNVKANAKAFITTMGKVRKRIEKLQKSFRKFKRSLMFWSTPLRFLGRGLMGLGKIGLRVFKGLISIAKKLIKVTLAVGAATTAVIIKWGSTFEKSMSRVKALSNATEKDFARLKKTAEDLGRSTEWTASQAAEAMSNLALAGFEVNEIITAMKPSLALASAGQVELATATNIVAKMMAGMGLQTEELNHAVDVLAQAFTTANTDLEMLGDAMKFVGPVGKVAGKSIEELVASIQVLSNVGLQGEMAGTALRGILAKLAGATPSTTKELEKLGIQIEAASGEMRPLADIVDDMNVAMRRMTATAKLAKIMTMFGLRAGPGMAALLDKGGDAIRDYNAALLGSAGRAGKIAETQLDNLAGSYVKLKSAIQGVALSIYGNLGPKVRYVLDYMRMWLAENGDKVTSWANIVYEKVWYVLGIFKNFVKYLTTDWKGALKTAFWLLVNFATMVSKAMGLVMDRMFDNMIAKLVDRLGAAFNEAGWATRSFVLGPALAALDVMGGGAQSRTPAESQRDLARIFQEGMQRQALYLQQIAQNTGTTVGGM